MKPHYGDGTVWVGVCIGAEAGGVIDRQGLDNLLAALVSPVNHLLDVRELTYAKTLICAE